MRGIQQNSSSKLGVRAWTNLLVTQVLCLLCCTPLRHSLRLASFAPSMLLLLLLLLLLAAIWRDGARNDGLRCIQTDNRSRSFSKHPNSSFKMPYGELHITLVDGQDLKDGEIRFRGYHLPRAVGAILTSIPGDHQMMSVPMFYRS